MTYVLDSDIYFKSDVTADPVAVTLTGANSGGRIANGVTDWLYEGLMTALWLNKFIVALYH